MTFSPYFDEELKLVDASASVTADEGATGYTSHEWSYSGSGKAYTILAGSENAARNAAATLLFDLGFRFYGPISDWIYRPASITSNLAKPKQTWWINSVNIVRAYASGWGGEYASESTTWQTAYQRWQTLNSCGPTSAAPAGHRWNGIVTGAFCSAWFNANPQYIYKPPGKTQAGWTFNLTGTLTAGEYDTLVEVVAAELLRNTSAINEFDRTNFDPEDGNTFDSDTVFQFAKDVAAKCRTGTSAIGPHPDPIAGRPNMSLGVYAYSLHRAPPVIDDYSGVFCQVALGFSKAGYASYPDLVRAHSLRSYDFIGTREYMAVQLWGSGQPISHNMEKNNYFDVYDSYKSSGVDAVNGNDTQAHWLLVAPAMRHALQKFRTGSSTYTAALTEIVSNIFGGDPAVQDLFELWSNPLQKWHIWNLKETFDLIEAMADEPYKDWFKYCAVIWYEIITLPEKLPRSDADWKTANDEFYQKFPVLLKHMWAIRNLHLLDSYALIREFANGNPRADYWEYKYSNTQVFYRSKTANFTVGAVVQHPTNLTYTSFIIKEVVDNGDGTGYLWVESVFAFADGQALRDNAGGSATVNGAGLRPDWWRNPYLPTTDEYNAAYAAVSATAARESDFDSEDLVMVHNVTPEAGTTNATGFTVTNNGPSRIVFVGSGTVNQVGTIPVYDDEGDPTGDTEAVNTPLTFTNGFHRIEEGAGNFTWTHEGGNMFMELFPRSIRGLSPGGSAYVWFPTRVNGAAQIYPESRIRLRNSTGQYDITPGVSAADLGPGQLEMDNTNSSGFVSFANVNKYISLRRDKILGPRVMVEEDYPALGKILKA